MATNSELLLSAYNYELPEHLIAHTPSIQRDQSRLLVFDKSQNNIKDHHFSDIKDYLKAGDLLVLNNTRVIPARIYGEKSHTGTPFEFLLLEPLNIEQNIWITMVKKSKRVKAGYIFNFSGGVRGEILTHPEQGHCHIHFQGIEQDRFMEWLEDIGEIPLPPYITNQSTDRERYQTVFNKVKGSVAAPTAGLHFTPELISQLKEKGIQFTFVTLHIGAGTFSPVRSEIITEHTMHTERFNLSKETAELLNHAKRNHNRIITVGTTATRVLETVYRQFNEFRAHQAQSSLFIYPGQTIQSIDGLITNFHLPQSTLMMLVSTWIGRKKLLELYQYAIEHHYRFYSFGDSMFLI